MLTYPPSGPIFVCRSLEKPSTWVAVMIDDYSCICMGLGEMLLSSYLDDGTMEVYDVSL